MIDGKPHVECAICWKEHKKHREAFLALKDDPIRFVAIEPGLEQPFMGLCARHAHKTRQKLLKRVRRIERFSTNLYIRS